MSEDFLRLVYVSKATSAIDQEVLQAILADSSARNASDGITGVLCAGRGHYLQVLEGSVRRVMSLYLRIMKDPRHGDSTLLSISLVAERLFEKWAMGYIEGSPHSVFPHEVLFAERNIDARNDRAAAILRRFVAVLKDRGRPPIGAAAVH